MNTIDLNQKFQPMCQEGSEMNIRYSIARLSSLIFVIAVMALSQQPAHALCTTPQEEGSWRNVDSNTRSLTRIELRFVCQDQIKNGAPYPPGAPWYVHVYGKCDPTDCDWGEVEAKKIGATGYVFAFYDQGFAKRYVYAKMSTSRRGQLYVYTWTDFADPSRPDYTVDNWFVRQ